MNDKEKVLDEEIRMLAAKIGMTTEEIANILEENKDEMIEQLITEVRNFKDKYAQTIKMIRGKVPTPFNELFKISSIYLEKMERVDLGSSDALGMICYYYSTYRDEIVPHVEEIKDNMR